MGDFMRRLISPAVDNDSPSCRASTGVRASRRAGLCVLIVGTGSGPEGSRPTAGRCRLQEGGDEKASGSTGERRFWQPSAYPLQNNHRNDLSSY